MIRIFLSANPLPEKNSFSPTLGEGEFTLEDLNAIVFNVSLDFARVLLFAKFVVIEILLSTPTTYYGIADIAITSSRMSVGVYISTI